MRTLNANDYQLFEQLVAMTQREMYQTMFRILKKKYEQIIAKPEYIVAIGDIPVALIAHMDTVFSSPVQDLYYDKQKNVMWSPDGLGADDRAGIFAILQILKSGLRPSIILTTDEEKGGVGASILTDDYANCPIPNLKYMIQLDRKGNYDAVFYDCISEDFMEYVESFGFYRANGSFSDISFLMPQWEICGVNLSIGYKDEHTYTETLHINQLQATISKVKKMLQVTDIPTFEYKEKIMPYIWNKVLSSTDGYEFDFGMMCCCCKKEFTEFETIPVKTSENITKFYCPDCVINNVDWCQFCGEPYELTNSTSINVCHECKEDKHGIQ